VYNEFASQLQKSTSAITLLQDSLAKQLEFDRNLLSITSSVLLQTRLVELTTSNFRDLSLANQSLTKLVSNAAITDSALSKVFAEHNALRASLDSIASQSSITDLLSSLDTTRLLHTSLSSQYRLLDLEANSFGRLIDASTILANDLTATFSKLTRSYRDVIECFPSIPQPQVTFIAKYSPIEYSLEMDVLERISVEHDEDIEVQGLPSIDDELASFNDQLLILVNGARESLKSDNPDRARHVMTSVRELFRHILHGLSPVDEIRKWSADANHYHNDQPTRRARLLYICRNFSGDPLTKFVEDDVRAALTLIDSLNTGTHAVQSKLTESQLKAIVYRMESLALFLLKISREN
jgi:hypothetical protein